MRSCHLLISNTCLLFSLTPYPTPICPLAAGDAFLTTVDMEAVSLFMKEVGKHPDLDEQTIAKLLALETQQHEHHSRAWYRVNASRAMAGRARVSPHVDEHTMEVGGYSFQYLNKYNLDNFQYYAVVTLTCENVP